MLGVLVVQNRSHRTYSDEEVEALQTTSMVIAEMIAAGEVEAIAKPGQGLDLRRAMQLAGLALADGVGLGHVVLHEPRVVVTNLIAEDIERERERLHHALDKLRLSLDDMLERRESPATASTATCSKPMRCSPATAAVARKMEEAIRNGLTAEAAAEKVQSDTRAQMLRSTDPYLRERLHDLDDLANRLMRELIGRPHQLTAEELPKDAIIVARNMGAASSSIMTASASAASCSKRAPDEPRHHRRPRAGAADGRPVPTVVSLVEPGDAIIVDGEAGDVQLRPRPDVEKAYAEKVRFRARRQAQYRRLRSKPAITRDGHTRLSAPQCRPSGRHARISRNPARRASACFRTELPVHGHGAASRVREQEMLYSRVLDAAGERPVTFRSLDIAATSCCPICARSRRRTRRSAGARSASASTARLLLRTQVRALLRAAAGRELRLMFPMITTVAEYRAARAMVDRELRHARRHGHRTPETIRLGAMIEVPSLLFELDELLDLVDFISVGSNDLFQFMNAADRGNPRLADRFDPLRCRSSGRSSSTSSVPTPSTCRSPCAARWRAARSHAMALLALGFRTISMPPAAIRAGQGDDPGARCRPAAGTASAAARAWVS